MSSLRPNLGWYVDHPSSASALLDAINSGKYHLTRFILDAVETRGIVNARDFNGKTPLIRACYIKEERTRGRVVYLLLQKHADVNLKDDSGRTALSYACEMRCNDVVQILVRNNVFPDIPDNTGTTPLMFAASVGNDRAIEILLRSFRRLGLDVDKMNGRGETALILSAKEGYLACASLLAHDGRANLKITDRDGLTAEQIAREQGCSTPEVTSFSARRRKPRDHSYQYLSKSRANLHRRKHKTAKKTVDTLSPGSTELQASRSAEKSEEFRLPRLAGPRSEPSYGRRPGNGHRDLGGYSGKHVAGNHVAGNNVTGNHLTGNHVTGSSVNRGLYTGRDARTLTDKLEALKLNRDVDLASATC